MAIIENLRHKVQLRTRIKRWTQAIRDFIAFKCDGLPYPPLELRALVSGDSQNSKTQYQEVGRICSTRIKDSLGKIGVNLDDFRSILDFGCGCGRTIRFFRHLGHTELYGTDYNPTLIQWCKQNLPIAQFNVNQLSPPLQYKDKQFDLVYAFSVLTHLPTDFQLSWMKEFSRILRDGGYLAISLHGMSLLPLEQRNDDLVVLNPDSAGANECSVYHSYNYVIDVLAKDFVISDYVEGGVGQDFYLLQKTPTSPHL